MDAHTTGEMAQKLMIFRLITDDTDAECGVWETLYYHAYEFDNVL